MLLRLRLPFTTIAPAALLAVLLWGMPATAQTAAPLPTAPGAERAVEGGLTQAHPSLPGGSGLSPLEPYLVTWLLPIGGLLTVAAAIFVDRQVRALDPRRKA